MDFSSKVLCFHFDSIWHSLTREWQLLLLHSAKELSIILKHVRSKSLILLLRLHIHIIILLLLLCIVIIHIIIIISILLVLLLLVLLVFIHNNVRNKHAFLLISFFIYLWLGLGFFLNSFVLHLQWLPVILCLPSYILILLLHLLGQ